MINIGDEVICINSKDTTHLKYMDIYLVKDVCYGGTHIILDGSFGYSGGDSTYSTDRFEKLEQSNANP